MKFKKIEYFLFTYFKGAAIGVGNIIPGVSGGTIAVIVGVYDKLIQCISDLFKKKSKNNLYFLIILFSGALSSILLLTTVIEFLLKNYSNLFMFFLIGLILGSISSIIKMRQDIQFGFGSILSLLIGGSIPVLLTIFLVGTSTKSVGSLSGLNLYNYLFLFITGVMAGGTMVIPGISGALIMVLFGQYSTVIFSVNNFLLLPLVFLSAGIIIGILGFAKMIRIFLNDYPAITLYCIIGLVLGSCYRIFPGFSKGATLLYQILILGVGLAFSMLINRIRKKESYL